MKWNNLVLRSILNPAASYSILLNMFYLILCLAFGNLRFEAIDDYFMAARLSGALGGDFNPHLVFVNAAYGYLLLPLYHIIPKINWYYVGEMFAVFVSLSSFSYIVLCRLKKFWGVFGASVLVYLLARDLYLGIQFTQCAAVLAAAGMSLFANAVINRDILEKIPKSFVVGIILIVWGSSMRWPAFLMGLPLFLLMVFVCIWRYNFTRKMSAIGLLIVIILSFGLHSFDGCVYETEEYKEFIAFQGQRVAVGDAVEYDKNAVLEDVEESGRDDDDFLMLTDWMFYDTETFAPDSVRVFAKMIKNHLDYKGYSDYPSYLLNQLGHSMLYPVFWLWFGCCILIFACNRSWEIYPWLSLFFILFMFYNLFQVGRFVYRVEIGFWLYAIALALPLLRQPTISLSRRGFSIIFVSLLLLSAFDFYSSGDMTRDPSSGQLRSTISTDSTDYEGVFKYIEQNPDKLFLVDMTSYMRFSKHRNPPYLSEPKGSFRRIISFGYWTPYLPEIKKTLSEFEISNPIKDVVKDNVVVVNAGGLSDFLDRHYHIKATAKEIKSIGNIHFYSYHLD